ncbi:MAG: hypothetical protein ACE5HD_03740 [Acidobacteriota bacterium]
MKPPGAAGGALPAALVLLLVLTLVATHLSLMALTARLGVARAAAGDQSYRIAEGLILLAATKNAGALAASLADGTPLGLDMGVLGQPRSAGSVRVMDDLDGDGDPAVDANGRLFLTAEGRFPVGGVIRASRRVLSQEALVGGLTPLPAAIVDCQGLAAMCGGTAGCPVPASRVDGGSRPALAATATGQDRLRQRLFLLYREILRAADLRCGTGSSACTPDDEDLRRAASTDVLRAMEDPSADALGLDSLEMSRLISNLLMLSGDESGAGTAVWFDGSARPVTDRALLVAATENLGRPAGHVPDLAGHPVTLLLEAGKPLGSDGGLCRRLAALLPAAMVRAMEIPAAAIGPAPGPPPARGTFVLSRDLRLEPGQALAGEGLLVVEATLRIDTGAEIHWSGALVLAGGRIQGPGIVQVEGGVLDSGRRADGSPGLDLSASQWQVQADPARNAAAWAPAGTVLLSSWEEVPGE